ANDIKFLETELDMWFYSILNKGWDKFAKVVQQQHADIVKSLTKQLSGLGVTEPMLIHVLDKKVNLKEKPPINWTPDEMMRLAVELRKETKPIIIAANRVDLPGAKANFDRLIAQFPQYSIVACSAESEIALREASKKELIRYIPGEKSFTILKPEVFSPAQLKALEYIQKNVLDVYGGTGVQQVLDTAVFKLLGYIAIYPGGVNKLGDSQGRILPDCFLMPKGSTALSFAFRLHSDFGNKFIRAIDVKTKKTVGKDHLLMDGDVVEIVADK
ncbi:MAG TPA: TGS domain-containing protein, partial [Acidobacteriota bacterium]|nr:TGS domain-containing protein [Acidobacteriota bacterium]